MFMRLIHAVFPHLCVLTYATQLSSQEHIKLIDMLFGPLDARRHEYLREALLVDVDCVLDDGEVNIGDLEDVVRKVAFKNALAETQG